MLFIIADIIGAITFFKFEIVVHPMNFNHSFFLKLHTVLKEGNLRCCCYAFRLVKGFQLFKKIWNNALL